LLETKNEMIDLNNRDPKEINSDIIVEEPNGTLRSAPCIWRFRTRTSFALF